VTFDFSNFIFAIFTLSNLLVSLVFTSQQTSFKGYTDRMSESDLVIVQSYATEGDAEVAKGVLQSSGIGTMIQADTAGRMREHLAWSGLGHRVLVREEDAAAARSLLAVPQNDDLGAASECNGDRSGNSARCAFVRRHFRNSPV
jgi:hypothetical protein